MIGPPFLALAAEIADEGKARAVIPLTVIADGDGVAGRPKHEHDSGMALRRQVRRVVMAIGQTIKRRLVAD